MRKNSNITAIINQLYEKTYQLSTCSWVSAAEYISQETSKLQGQVGENIETGILNSLFYSTVYKNARIELSNRVGIKVTDSIYENIEALSAFCMDHGVNMASKLHELGGLNALGTMQVINEEMLNSLVNLAAQLKEIPDISQIEYREDRNTHTLEVQINRNKEIQKKTFDIQNAPGNNKDNNQVKTIEKILTYFVLERQYTNKFMRAIEGKESIEVSNETFVLSHNKQIHVYKAKNRGFRKVVGDIIFNPLNHNGEGYKIFTDFYQSLVGDDIATPIGVHKGKIGTYNVMHREAMDLEVFLNSSASSYQKYAAIANNLLKHHRLEESLDTYTEKKEGRVIKKIRYYEGLIDIWLTYNSKKHNYEEELLESLILGRASDKKYRLANNSEFEEDTKENNNKRTLIPNRNQTLDLLYNEGKNFIARFLEIPELEQLDCFTDFDAQPSNYFVNGKISDLDKIRFGSPAYMAARLLGHPITQQFLGSISTKTEEKYFLRYIQTRNNDGINQAVEYIQKHPGLKTEKEGHLFAIYSAKKLIEKGIKYTSQVQQDLQMSFNAHKAWINAFHVFSYECRAQDRKASVAHFKQAMIDLKKEEFIGFKDAYVAAIAQTPHQHLLLQ